jgi:magnesium transporter
MDSSKSSTSAKQDLIRRVLLARDPEAMRPVVAELGAAQAADLLEALPPERRNGVWALIAPQLKGDVLVEVRREVRRQLIDASSADELTASVGQLHLDALSDLYPELPAAVSDAVLRAMGAQRRQRFELVRSYADDTAGGLMDTDALAVRPDVTLGMVMDYLALLRVQEGPLPEELDAIAVTDLDGRYLGRLALVDVVSLRAELKVEDAMDAKFAPIDAQTPAARVARRFEDENLVSAPVVDAEFRLLGRIKVDDVLDYLRAKAEHAVLAPIGLNEDVDTFAPALHSSRKRAAWLGVNLVFALVASAVIGLFDGTIQRLVALAVLMPVVSSMGGVAGTQSLMLVIRGLALEQVDESNRWRLLRRELAVAGFNGALWALVVGTLAGLWFDNWGLSLVAGAAILLNIVAGVAAGALIPLALERLGTDAAIAGEVLLVAFTDTFGFLAVLGLATLYLR